MGKQKNVFLVLSAIGMAILVLDGKTAIMGMRAGIQICIHTLIPSLFPFLFLSGLLTDSLRSIRPGNFKHPLKRCRIPDSLAALLPIGWLGGYPMGARCAARLVSSGQASPQNATRFAVICNNAGPAFLFGILGCFFARKSTVFVLWFIHLFSAVLAGLFLFGEIPLHSMEDTSPSRTFNDILNDSLWAMGSICGCVLLFRMILEFLNNWFLWLLPEEFQILVSGCLELSNGCLQLDRLSSEHIRFITASVMLSFGGFCVWMQTVSVFPALKLSLYIRGKLLQSYFSLILSAAVVFLSVESILRAAVCAILVLIPFLFPLPGLSGRKKEVAI